MITVKIPKEIRDYKEKLAFGLTARQIIALLLGCGICIPLYIYGIKYINEEIVSYLVMAIALPIGGIGFITKNGMPFEKYMVVMFKHNFLYPQKTVYKSKNYFRDLEAKADRENEPASFIDKYRLKKFKEQATLERAFLMEEAERNGEIMKKRISNEDLLTVRTPYIKNNKKKEDGEDNNKKKQKETKKKKENINKTAKKVAEAVEKKQKENPHYIPTKREGQMMLAHAKNVEKEKNRLAEVQNGVKAVAKKNDAMKKRRKAKTFIPKSTQDDLPYIADYDEGLFEVEPNKYSKCYELRDINYLTAKEDEAVAIFYKWGEFLNYFDEEMTIGLIIDNRIISLSEKEKLIFYQMCGDDYDVHRKEYNRILKKQMIAGNNDIQKNKYITVTIDADSPYEALLRFHKIDGEVITNLRKIGADGKVMSTDDRLSYLHDKMRKGREGEFRVDYNFLKTQGLSSKDYVAPSSFTFKGKDFFMIEDTYCRCMFVNNLPSLLSDEFILDITDCEFPVITSFSIQPVAQDKAIHIIKKQITGMDANIIEAQKKAIRAGYDPSIINHDLVHSAEEGKELLSDMQNKSQKMFYVSIMLMVSGDTLDELNDNTKILESKARKYTCQMQKFDNQQRDAFKVILPMGVTPSKKLYVERTLTTESTSIFIPFSSQELFQIGGWYYGLNQLSRNLILCNRLKMKTPSGFILGSSGSGKSFACKREMLNVLLSDDKTSLLVIDPENEYGNFCRAFSGTVINLSATSDNFISPMEMDENYGLEEEDDVLNTPLDRKKEKALLKKSEYLMSIIQCMVEEYGGIKPQQKSLIDRAIRRTYKEYLEHDFDQEYLPTLLDLQDELDKEKDTEEGREIAESVEYYTKGSMNLFSHKSNVDLNNRFVVFSIRDLGKELEQIALLITLDFIWNRMTRNATASLRTYCYVDEIHVLFQNEFSARYLRQLYKRGRKYGLVITGITQDIEDLLNNDMAKGMLSNSDFILMLSQKAENLKKLKELLGFSEAQSYYVNEVEAGSGLLVAEKSIVPFDDDFPEDSYLYKLMSTKFGESNNDEDMLAYIEKLQKEQRKREEAERQEKLRREELISQIG